MKTQRSSIDYDLLRVSSYAHAWPEVNFRSGFGYKMTIYINMKFYQYFMIKQNNCNQL